MKNIFRFWMAVAIICGAVSCAKEDISSSLAGGEVEVTFTANLPELGTRAYGNAEHITILHYNVYQHGQEEKLATSDVCTENNGGTFIVNIPMIKGMKYDIVFWAEKEGNGFYSLDGKVLTINYKDAIANDENRDAFLATLTGFDPSSAAHPYRVELKRPFAQLNVATSDYETIEDNGIDLTANSDNNSSDLKITTQVDTKFNLFTNEVADGSVKQTVTFDASKMPCASGEALNNYAGYTYLSMNYIFVLGEKESVDIEYNFTGNRATDNFKFPFTKVVIPSVPLKRNYRTNILGKLLTQTADFEVVLDKEFENTVENIFPVATTAELQKALDEAVANTTIRLAPNVNYGVVYIRPVAGSAATKEVDWQGNNYRWETYSCFEGLTIQGAVGATIDAIQIEGHTYYNTHHSQADKYPVMLSLIELKNVVLDGVTFTGKGGYDPQGYGNAINLSGSNIKVDGLTFKNCVLKNNENNARLLYKTESTTRVHTYTYENETFTFIPSLKNITITGCTFDGGYMGVELRETENVTITDNEFKVADRNILLPVNSGCTYSGNVTITGNVSYNAQERFVRMAGAGDAVVVIKDNSIVNYHGTDADYIKVTDGNNVTIENNICSRNSIKDYDEFLSFISDDDWYEATKTELAIEDVADFAAFVETVNSGNNFEGKTIKLANDIDLYFKDITELADGDPATFRPIGDTKYNGGKPFKGTFDGQGHTIKNLYQNGWDLGYHWYNSGSYGLFGTLENATVKNVVIEGSESYIEGGDVSFIAGTATGNCVFEDITINSGVAATYNAGCGSIIGWSLAGTYTFKNITIGEDVVLAGLWGSFDSSIGGIVGQAEPGATYNFEDVTINCRIDAYNDCTASNDYYNYRMCGMIIGRCAKTTTIDGKNYPDLSKYNLTFNNVVVNYGDWMNYHYCEPTPGHNEGRGMRVEPGYAYDGLPADYDHSQCVDNHMNYIPFDQLIGGDQYGVKGLREVNGVTVNYPASYRREVSSANALNEALCKGLSVILDADIDFGSTQLAITGENQVVDLVGHTLTTANNWGGISLKNGASIKNGTINHTGNTAAIKAWNVESIENVTINVTPTDGKVKGGIVIQEGADNHIALIKNVTITGATNGIETYNCGWTDNTPAIGAMENVNINATDTGILLSAHIGKATNCNIKGANYGINMHLKGEYRVGIELENCTVEGTTASIWGHDEKGISNTNNCSLTLTYDAATKLVGPFIWDFEEECQSVVTLNRPQ